MQEKKILIAGVSGSLGTSIAEVLLENNYSVVGLTRKSSTKLGNRGNLKVYNNFDYEKLQEITNIDFDVFISCIGSYSDTHVSKINESEIEEMYKSNLLIPSKILIQVFKDFISKNSGLLININSIAADASYPQKEILYSSSKAALKRLIESLQTQTRIMKSDVKVIDVFIGAFKSEITANRPDYQKLIEPNDISKLILSQILNESSLLQDKIYIKRNIY